jgi:Tol biopolymer transport system component
LTGQRLPVGDIGFDGIPEGPMRDLLRRCLDRNLKTRLQHIGEARIAIERYAEPVAAAPAARGVNWLLMAAVALLAAGGEWLLSGRGEKAVTIRTAAEIMLPRGNLARGVAVSPDGRLIAAAAGEGIWLRRLDSLDRQLLPGTRGAFIPAWSPDSKALGYVANRTTVQKIAVDGGVAQTLTSDAAAPWLSWGEDGTILFSGPRGELWKVPAAGGEPSQVTSPGKEAAAAHMAPLFLPGGKQFLFMVQSAEPAKDGVYAGMLGGPSDQPGRRVLESRFLPIHTMDEDGRDWLLYRKGLALFAQPFDLRALALRGEPIQVAPEVQNRGPRMAVSASKNGLLLYLAEDLQRREQLAHVWFDRKGNKVGEMGPAGTWVDMALAPDGTKLAATLYASENNEMNLWLMEARPGSERVRFTFEPTRFLRWPVWSPDGKRLLYTANTGSAGGGTYERPADGTAVQKAVPGLVGFPTGLSPDGRMVLSQREGDLWLYQDGKATQLTKTPFAEEEARFSPDGRWIAYESNETQRKKIWVQEFPLSGVRFQISTEGGGNPRWRRDGKELFYKGPNGKVMAVPVTTAPRFVAGTRQELFRHALQGLEPAPDGQRFLVRMATEEERSSTERYIVKTHWSAGAKR